MKAKKEFEPKHYSIISDIWFYICFYRKHEPVVLLCCAIEILLSAGIPLLSIYLPKITIDLVVKGVTVGRIAEVLGTHTLFMMLIYGSNSGISNGKYNLYTAQITNLMGLYFLKSLRIPYADAESGEIKKVYWKAYDATQGGDWSAGSRMVYETVSLSVNTLSFFLYSTVIGYLSVPMLLVLLVLSLINYAISMRYIKFAESVREESALAQKHFYCVLNAMSNEKGAKDIRIFGMKNWMLGLRDVTLGELKKLTEKIRKKNAFYEKIGFALAAVRNLGAYAYLLHQASQGVVSAGEKIALVGVNGAGKTTLVKLLCGMYEPDEGQILINGVDRNEFSKEEWYRLFSVIFQEPLIFPFTIGENLSMDCIERIDEKRAWEALDKAGLKQTFWKNRFI